MMLSDLNQSQNGLTGLPSNAEENPVKLFMGMSHLATEGKCLFGYHGTLSLLVYPDSEINLNSDRQIFWGKF